jgi:nitroreductase
MSMSAIYVAKNQPDFDHSLLALAGGELSDGQQPSKFETLRQIVHARRAVRSFDQSIDSVPDSVMNECFDLALLAPSSSNLQPWQFFRVKSRTMKARFVDLCCQQPSALSASEFVVCVGRVDRWWSFRNRMLAMMREQNIFLPAPFDKYYQVLVPQTYFRGPLGIVGRFTQLLCWLIGLFRPFPSAPSSRWGMRLWAVKNTALATMILMLALAARGWDSCPMDGHDKRRIKKLLGLPGSAQIFVVLAVGKRAADDVKFGPRLRFPRDLFVGEV